MTSKHLLRSALVLVLGLSAGNSIAQQWGVTARYTGTLESRDQAAVHAELHPESVSATSSVDVIVFNNELVGTSAGSAQTLTATFAVSGYTGSFTPTAALHFGHDYSLGTVSCTTSGGGENCSVPISFQPTLPGGRKDALFLKDGTTTLANVLLGGVGDASLALVQPGVVTSPVTGDSGYIYNSTVDENGTVYYLQTEQNAVYSLTPGGTPVLIPITGLTSPDGIAIDGAGVLYISQNTYSKQLITYDTVTGVQGALTLVPPAPYVPCSNSNDGNLEYLYSVAVDHKGDLYALEILCGEIFELKADGSYVTTAINPVMTQPSQLAVDSTGDLFVSGYAINELASGGTQSQINTVGASEGLSADAAGTLYATRYTGGGVAELPASNFATSIANLDPTAGPLGESLGSDGTLYVGNYTQLDKVDRSQGAISFGEQFSGTTSTAQNVGIYNGGNETLTLSTFSVSGVGFALSSPVNHACSEGLTIAPGAYCQVSVTLTPPHAGTYSGTITFTSNSLNTTATQQTVALSGFVYGAYVTPSPVTLNFNQQEINTSLSQNVTLTNSGDLYSAGFGGATYSVSGYTFNLGACTSALSPGASCQASVTFAPTAVQTYDGVVTVPYSSSGGGPGLTLSINVNGQGINPVPQAVLSPNPLAFTDTPVFANNQLTVKLSNPGTATLTGINPTIAQGQPHIFTIYPTTTCGTTLAVGDSCNITIEFSPQAPFAYEATLSVADNASGSPQTVPITGLGTSGQLQFTPTILSLLGGSGSCSRTPVFNGPATSAPFCTAGASAVDSQGNEYIVDQDYNTVIKIDTSGNASVFAGVPTLSGSYGGDNGPSASANLNVPLDVVVDSSDNVYISDYSNNRIRKVDAVTGNITTFAGSGGLGFFNGGPATSIALGGPQGLTFDPSGNLYYSTGFGHIIVKIDAAGNASLFAGEQSDSGPGIPGYSGDGGKAYAATLDDPQGLASDAQGDIYIADTNNWVVRKVDPSGIITTYAGNHQLGQGNTGDGGAATSAEISAVGVGTDLAGNLYISEGNGNGNLIRKVDVNGVITTYAGGGTGGSGGPATSASLSGSYFARVDLNGDLIIPSGKQVYFAGPQGILQFGSQNLNTTSVPLTLTLTNTGNAPLIFASGSGAIGKMPRMGTSAQVVNASSIFGNGAGTITGDFAIASGGTCDFSAALAVGASCTLNVNFTPTTTGSLTGSITITTQNGANLFTPSVADTVQLSGTGTQTLVAATPVISPATGTYFTDQTVTITDSTPSAIIHYTTDGSTPSTSSLVYSAPFTVSRTGTNVQAIAAATGYTTSAPALATYTLQAVAPVLNPPGGTYTGSQSVAMTTTTLGATIYYTTNGIAPSTESTVYSGPISISQSGTVIEAIAALSGYNNSTVTSGTYTIENPAVTLAPTSLNFSQPESTTSAAQTITLTNSGTSALTISSIVVIGSNPGDFSESNNCVSASPLAAKASCTISVKFTPPGTSTYTAAITISDSASGSQQTVPLTGTGTYTKPQVTLLPSTLNFGNVTEGTTSAAQIVTLTNTGTSPFTITSVILSGAGAGSFALNTSASTCGATLAVGSSCVYSITFSPLSVAAFSATFAVTDSPDAITEDVSLSGVGTAPAAPLASLTPASLTFTSNTGVASSTQTATLTNTGNAALVIGSITLTGTNPSDFSQSNTCGESLAAGASCTISVIFTPASASSFAAALSITDNATGSPQSTTLSGTGVIPTGDFAVSSTTSPQTINAGAAATFNIVVATTPSGDLYNNAVALSASGLPAGATASFSPASVTPGTGSGASTLTIQTAASATTSTAANQPSSSWPLVVPSIAFLMGGFTLFFRRKRYAQTLRGLSTILILAGTGLASLAVMGCGGGFALPQKTVSTSTPTTYVITVTGISGSDTHSTTVSLTVN